MSYLRDKVFTKKNVAAAIKDVEREEAKRMKKKTPKMTKEQVATVLGDDKALTKEWMSHATFLFLKGVLEKEIDQAHQEFVEANSMLDDYDWNKSGVKWIKRPKNAPDMTAAREKLWKYFSDKRTYLNNMLSQLWYAYSLAAHPNVVADIKKNK